MKSVSTTGGTQQQPGRNSNGLSQAAQDRQVPVVIPQRTEADRASAAEQLWAGLPPVTLDPREATARHLIISHHDDPVGLLYDHLRTRLLHIAGERGWKRVAITSPTRGCGTTHVAANLALSLARRPSGKTVLMDFDLRSPALHERFGVTEPGQMRDLLTREYGAESHLLRLGRNLALGLNEKAEGNAAELLQEPSTATALAHLVEDFQPEMVLFDLPPMLGSDDVFGFLPLVDGVLLVADGTKTTPAEIRACEEMIRERSELIGVVLNRAEDSPARKKGWF